jgi:hypothetical protein
MGEIPRRYLPNNRARAWQSLSLCRRSSHTPGKAGRDPALIFVVRLEGEALLETSRPAPEGHLDLDGLRLVRPERNWQIVSRHTSAGRRTADDPHRMFRVVRQGNDE